ncbi:hypothetical protein CCH79_00020356, partial [Gambusia affinis]
RYSAAENLKDSNRKAVKSLVLLHKDLKDSEKNGKIKSNAFQVKKWKSILSQVRSFGFAKNPSLSTQTTFVPVTLLRREVPPLEPPDPEKALYPFLAQHHDLGFGGTNPHPGRFIAGCKPFQQELQLTT